MDQEGTMDFKALRAKFQEEELLLKQPRVKPALPEKPKVLPPPNSPTHHLPNSPTHHLPAGARPSLLTSISQSLEGNSAGIAPRVIFKEDKKESKRPLIQPKGKEKGDGKLKMGKDKSLKASKGKPDADGKSDLLVRKQKKEKDKKLAAAAKEGTAELVQATPPPKATKKKGFMAFRRSLKKETAEVPADSILDAPSGGYCGPAPLIPVPPAFGDTIPEAPDETQTLKEALMPHIPTTPASSAALIPHIPTTPASTPPSPDIHSPPAFIPDTPALKVPSPEIKTPHEIETPTLPVSAPLRPATPVIDTPAPPSPIPSPPPGRSQLAISSPPPATSPPSPPPPEVAAVAGIEVADTTAVEKPPSPVPDPPSIPASPIAERPISALSALERAEEMIPTKKTSPADQRILAALEKARRKIASNSPLVSPSTSHPTTPLPDEAPRPSSPIHSLPELPPIDYDDQKTAQVNGFHHRQASPMLEGIAEEGSDLVPELLVVPPPPPRTMLPEPESSLGLLPEKPVKPSSVDIVAFLPPPLEDNAEIPAPPEFSEADTSVDLPEFEDVGSDDYSPELLEWGNGEYAGPDAPGEHTLPETMDQFYSNGITVPEVEVHGAPEFGVELQDTPQEETALDQFDSSTPVCQDTQTNLITGQQAEDGTYENDECAYEDVTSATKKKGKNEGGKKRKGPPKNPYAETQQPANEEKGKTGRFSKLAGQLPSRRTSTEGPDEKEVKKKEKQRLEKEKKELKEQREREKKEQKEREKKENEMKKKFKITGQEEAMYEANVTVTTKGRKHDLPVNRGDLISIIRTTNCPVGKWLARDSSNTYGYIAVSHVELDIKEMLELGKKAAISRKNSSDIVEAEATSMGSRTSNHYPQSTGSFTDDSEEWACDDDELLTPTETIDPLNSQGHTRTHSMPDMGNRELSIIHQHSQSDISAEGSQARHEALQKLATFFHAPKPEVEPPASSTEPDTSPVSVEEEAAPLPDSISTYEMDGELSDMLILPPPDLYADIITVE